MLTFLAGFSVVFIVNMNEYGYLQASTITERDEINVDGKNNQSALPAHMFEMTDELKQLILDRHNEARDEVEPPASPSLRHLVSFVCYSL